MRGEKARQFDCIEGWRHLVDAVQTFGETHEISSKSRWFFFIDTKRERLYAFVSFRGIEVFDKYLMAHGDGFFFKKKEFKCQTDE